MSTPNIYTHASLGPSSFKRNPNEAANVNYIHKAPTRPVSFQQKIAAPAPYRPKPTSGPNSVAEIAEKGASQFLATDHYKPTATTAPTPNMSNMTDFTSFKVRRSKSEKNFGRMYLWDTANRTFVSWVDGLTQCIMDDWYVSCQPEEQAYWSQVYEKPTDLQVALEAIANAPPPAPSTTTKQIPKHTTHTHSYGSYAPVLSAPLLPTQKIHMPRTENRNFGFAGTIQAADQARMASTGNQYRQLYRDLIFHIDRVENVASRQGLLETLKKIETEKMITELASQDLSMQDDDTIDAIEIKQEQQQQEGQFENVM